MILLGPDQEVGLFNKHHKTDLRDEQGGAAAMGFVVPLREKDKQRAAAPRSRLGCAASRQRRARP
jgi:hypothetical protein